jgi:para-nitrobenzyl esterase
MFTWSKRLVVLCAGLALAVFPTAMRAADRSAQITVDGGILQGALEEGVEYYKGIPFAAPPVGQLRWEAPQPAAPWQGVRDASEFVHDCMQASYPGDVARPRTTLSEDCLYLNVWRPAGGGAKLPVMVWIYGGAFTNGATSAKIYDGAEFAKDGVILVSMNYRVGRFGFFGHPALTAANPNGLLGNYGYLDQMAALKWVKKNIAAFGGDPDNVTVFGESAGGLSIHTLLVSPLAAGLFNKAIIESGAGRTKFAGIPVRQLSQDLPGVPSADSIGLAFAKTQKIEGTGADALAALRALPADDIVDGLSAVIVAKPSPTFSGPMQDGKILAGLADDLYKSGQFNRVPLMVGANSMDLGFNAWNSVDAALSPFGADKEKARDVYDPRGIEDTAVVAWNVMADKIMVEPARFAAQEFSNHGLPVYEYRFSYVSPAAVEALYKGPYALLETSNPMFWRMMISNAGHGAEIPYVFNTLPSLFGGRTTANDKLMAKIMHTFWVDFAKTGDPNKPGFSAAIWPAYTTQNDTLMNFTPTGPKAMPDPWKARLDLTAAHTN